MAITLRDVAEKSGFSLAAVSKALHGRGNTVRVSEDSVARIQKVARDLNYRPNRLARSLRENKTYNIGLIFRELGRLGDGPMFKVQVIDSMNEVFVPAGYDLTLLHSLVKGSSTDELEDGRFDGLMWCRLASFDELSQAVSRARMPIVALATPKVNLPIPTFCCNDQEGMNLMMSHFVALGHRSVIYGETENEIGSLEGDSRRRAFLGAAQKYSVSHEALIFNDVAKTLAEMMALPSRPTALFAWNEHLAGHVLDAAPSLGILIPRDLSLATFDSTLFCESVTPKLTAVRQQTEKMAFEASQTLLAMIEGLPYSVEHRMYSCSLDIRESTAPPPTDSK